VRPASLEIRYGEECPMFIGVGAIVVVVIIVLVVLFLRR